MTQRPSYPFNIYVPNLLNICIDNSENEEISGRLYHCYDVNPIRFRNVVELIQSAEKIFDAILFPQASTKTRSFIEREIVYEAKPQKVVNQEELLKYCGEKATIITSVRFRQKSTWQGEFFLMGENVRKSFTSIIDFIKKIDQIME